MCTIKEEAVHKNMRILPKEKKKGSKPQKLCLYFPFKVLSIIRKWPCGVPITNLGSVYFFKDGWRTTAATAGTGTVGGSTRPPGYLVPTRRGYDSYSADFNEKTAADVPETMWDGWKYHQIWTFAIFSCRATSRKRLLSVVLIIWRNWKSVLKRKWSPFRRYVPERS